jgi:phosphate transport system substrate-binding protein
MEFYIIARKNDISENSQKLIDWFLSEQGQALIEDVGYIPIKKANNDSARTFKYVRSNKSV